MNRAHTFPSGTLPIRADLDVALAEAVKRMENCSFIIYFRQEKRYT